MRGYTATAIILLITGTIALGADAATDQWDNNSNAAPDREDALIVVTDDDEQLTISMHDGSLLRITTDDGEEQVVEFDLTLVESVLEEAMLGVQEVLAELSELHVEVQLDEHDSIVIGSGDETVVLDLPEIMAEVQSSLADALQDMEFNFDTGIYKSYHPEPEVTDTDDTDVDMLRDELTQLRDEVKRLRAELRGLQRDR